jgi:hypothetical protein
MYHSNDVQMFTVRLVRPQVKPDRCASCGAVSCFPLAASVVALEPNHYHVDDPWYPCIIAGGAGKTPRANADCSNLT